MNKVPNEFPTANGARRIAIIGEAPGELEDAYGRPFVGPAGKMLGHILQSVGLNRNQVFIGNLCQVRPPDNKLSAFSPTGTERIEGLAQLMEDIVRYNPDIVILLGNYPLQAAGQTINITSYRGTFFKCTDPSSPFFNRKCVGTFHPASLLHGSYANLPIIIQDFKKAIEESAFPEVRESEKTYDIDLTADEVIERIDSISTRGDVLVSFDIEGGIGNFPCCSISTDTRNAFIIAFRDSSVPGGSRYQFDEELRIWEALSRMLSDPRIPKCLQNSLYDRFVLAYRYHMCIRNVREDTMLKHWELHCEFEKGLGFQTSFYSNEAYYKSERKSQSQRDFWIYCCKDSAITLGNCQSQELLLTDEILPYAREHYRFNMALLNIFLYMELKGILYDDALAKKKIAGIETELFALQHRINVAVLGQNYLRVDKVLEAVCVVRRNPITCAGDVVQWARKSYAPVAARIGALLEQSSQRLLTDAELGELSLLSDNHFNCESAKQKAEYLYGKRNFPEVRNRVTRQVTTNYEALLSIAKKTSDPVVMDILKATELLTRAQMLRIKSDPDGRIRCGYNVVGTNTGRITCYTSPTGSGYNLQTIPDEDRDLYLPDPGHYFFQCDLSGADAWTVACWCAKMGDRTMLDDLLYGVKIAKVVALMFLKGPQISNLPRPELAELCSTVNKKDPIYFGSKCCQHATNYDAQEVTVSATIFTQSEGAVNIPTKDCRVLQAYYNQRYPGLQRYKNFAASQLLNVGRVTAASGHTRVFYGNRRDHHVFKQFLAFEPQANTTFATNLAALRLWKDQANRTQSGGLVIQPLHQVHDALAGQFPVVQAVACCDRIGDYFNNPICIAGQTVTIPFEGGYGKSWKDLGEGVILPKRAQA